MKLIHLHRKPISMFMMFIFTILLCFWANQAPAAPVAPATEKKSETTSEQGESGSPNFIEQQSGRSQLGKPPSMLTRILVASVLVIVAVGVYILIKKKSVISPARDLTGNWSGSGTLYCTKCEWRGGMGSFYMTLQQSGNIVTGTVSFNMPQGINIAGDDWDCSQKLTGTSAILNGVLSSSNFTFNDEGGGSYDLAITNDTMMGSMTNPKATGCYGFSAKKLSLAKK